MYVGMTRWSTEPGEWLGVAYDKPWRGGHDGSVDGIRYFTAAQRSACFVPGRTAVLISGPETPPAARPSSPAPDSSLASEESLLTQQAACTQKRPVSACRLRSNRHGGNSASAGLGSPTGLLEHTSRASPAAALVVCRRTARHRGTSGAYTFARGSPRERPLDAESCARTAATCEGAPSPVVGWVHPLSDENRLFPHATPRAWADGSSASAPSSPVGAYQCHPHAAHSAPTRPARATDASVSCVDDVSEERRRLWDEAVVVAVKRWELRAVLRTLRHWSRCAVARAELHAHVGSLLQLSRSQGRIWSCRAALRWWRDSAKVSLAQPGGAV